MRVYAVGCQCEVGFKIFALIANDEEKAAKIATQKGLKLIELDLTKRIGYWYDAIVNYYGAIVRADVFRCYDPILSEEGRVKIDDYTFSANFFAKTPESAKNIANGLAALMYGGE